MRKLQFCEVVSNDHTFDEKERAVCNGYHARSQEATDFGTLNNTDEGSVMSTGTTNVEDNLGNPQISHDQSRGEITTDAISQIDASSHNGEGTSRDAIHVESDFGDPDNSEDDTNEEGLMEMDEDGDALGRGEETDMSVSETIDSFDPDDEHAEDVQFCHNCMRCSMGNPCSEVNQLDLMDVSSLSIKALSSHLRQLQCTRTNNGARVHRLCRECRNYLMDPSDIEWKNTWPSFLWNLLSGKDASTGRFFHKVYDPKYLWKLVPQSLRPNWIGAIRGRYGVEVMQRARNNVVNVKGFAQCSIDSPEPFFIDRTTDVKSFFDDVKSYKLKRLLHCLSAEHEKPCMIPDVLCPWGCTEFCFRARNVDLGLFIQHHLRRVQLNFPNNKWYENLYLVETCRDDYFRKDPNDYDKVLLNDNWPILPSITVTENDGLAVLVCRHHATKSSRKRLYHHPPRKPHHNLSSEHSDQLCPTQVHPRQFKPVQVAKYNTMIRMDVQEASYSGVASCNITTSGRFTRPSTMLGCHEMLSIAGRKDINHLVLQNVHEGVMTEHYAWALCSEARQMYPPGSMDSFRTGATYVGMRDSMTLQIESQNKTIPVIVKRKNRRGQDEEVTIAVQRSWSPLINFLHTEDPTLYGTPPKAIRNYWGRQNNATMMLWAVSSAIAGCKELHSAIDKKSLPF